MCKDSNQYTSVTREDNIHLKECQPGQVKTEHPTTPLTLWCCVIHHALHSTLPLNKDVSPGAGWGEWNTLNEGQVSITQENGSSREELGSVIEKSSHMLAHLSLWPGRWKFIANSFGCQTGRCQISQQVKRLSRYGPGKQNQKGWGSAAKPSLFCF